MNFYSLSPARHKGFLAAFSRFFRHPQDTRGYPPRPAVFPPSYPQIRPQTVEFPAAKDRDLRIGCGPATSGPRAATGDELAARLAGLPGFGQYKAQITTALLGKQLGVRPDGWREAAGRFGEEGSHWSVADVTDRASLAAVREHKKQLKAAAKTRA